MRVVTFLLASITLVAQPKFDVASVKPAAPTAPGFVRPQPGGRFTASSTLRNLIATVYGIFPFQIVGGPEWLATERYEIEAKADGSPTNQEQFQMVRSLLEERFQLKLRHETREAAIYALVTAKNGPKLDAPKEGNCTADTSTASAARTIMKFPCGRLLMGIGEKDGILKGGNVIMSELTRVLSTMMGRPVVDKTGFASAFDVDLHFIPDTGTAGLPNAAVPDAPDPAQATIFTALQEKLGLKLESTKGPVEHLIIDHVEKPSAN
jgi:uncharacterized protein (TIGR03435 family)